MPIIKLHWNNFLWVLLPIGLLFFFSCSSSGNRKENLETSVESTVSHQVKKTKTSKRNSETYSIVSWNLNNFGYSKNDNKVDFIANTIHDFDIVALQEVVGKSGGADAVIRLVHQLNEICEECKWDYDISKLTSGTSQKRERYAFLWKGSKVKRVGLGHLEANYEQEIEREPFLLTFQTLTKSEFTLVNFHALPKASQPETEIKYFKFLPDLYPHNLLIFLGDFNIPQSHSVFNPLKKMGYKPALVGQKTSLRQKCINGDCLASEYDNIFYPEKDIIIKNSGVIHFYKEFKNDMKEARKISDHVPVYLEFKINE